MKPQLTPAAAAEAAVVASMRQPGKRRAFVPHTEQLSRLPLQAGQNTIDFCFGRQRLSAYLYFLQWDARWEGVKHNPAPGLCFSSQSGLNG